MHVESAPVRQHDGRMLSALGFHNERRKIDRVMARSRRPSVFRHKLSQRHKHRGIGGAGIPDHQRCTGNPAGYRGPARDGTVAACCIPGPAQVLSPNFPAGCAGVCQIEFQERQLRVSFLLVLKVCMWHRHCAIFLSILNHH
jgi:hypothetical protein